MKKNEKGITLLALVITIIIILILTTVGISVGTGTLSSAKFTVFTTELKLMQSKVNELNQNNVTNIGTNYENMEEEQKTVLDLNEVEEVAQVMADVYNVSEEEWNTEKTKFIYLTKDYIVNELGLDGITRDFLINIEKRYVISAKAVKYDGTNYYMLEQTDNNYYNVQYTNPNGEEGSYDVSENKEENKWKIQISNIQYNSGYINEWQVKYKLAESDIWKTSNSLTFYVDELGRYEIKVVHGNEIDLGTTYLRITGIELSTGIEGEGGNLQGLETFPYLPDNTFEVSNNVDEGDLEHGLVIKDDYGNEYVWIEVPTTIYTDSTYTVANSNNPVTSNTDYSGIYNILNKYAETYRNTASSTDEWYAVDGSTIVTASTSNLTDTQKKLNTGCGLTYYEYDELYKKMLSNVYQNGGFWIGRYEVGIDGTNVEGAAGRTSHTETTEKGVVQKDAIPYNFVYCNEAQTVANKISSGNYTTNLMFGIQWDLVCKYIEIKATNQLTTAATIQQAINSNSIDFGNYVNSEFYVNSTNAKKFNMTYSYTGWNQNVNWTSVAENTKKNSYTYLNYTNCFVLFTTGATNYTKILNIYDLAGNEAEWTLEKGSGTSPCIYRGGSYMNFARKYTILFLYNARIPFSFTF